MGEGEDDFIFMFLCEDFFNFFFEDMVLFDFVKCSFVKIVEVCKVCVGFLFDGILFNLLILWMMCSLFGCCIVLFSLY